MIRINAGICLPGVTKNVYRNLQGDIKGWTKGKKIRLCYVIPNNVRAPSCTHT